MAGVTKTFGSVIANQNINLDIRYGEVLSLLGENGSGKTTLMNMLSGIYFPDAGQIYVNDEPVTIRSPKDAYDLKIGMIHQHFKLVDVFTAAENIVLGLHEGGRYDKKEVARRVREICAKYGFDMCEKLRVMGQTSPVMKLPMWIPYLSIPMGMVLGVVHLVSRELMILLGRNQGEKEDPVI